MADGNVEANEPGGMQPVATLLKSTAIVARFPACEQG